jgi:CRISPR-associated protein Cas2
VTVVVLTAVPVGLRGVLTRWLLEIAPGVFVGYVSRRIREHLWNRIVEGIKRGRAILVFAQRSEQRLGFWVHGHDWHPVDFDGLSLMLRPEAEESSRAKPAPAPPMWSYAERRLRGKGR